MRFIKEIKIGHGGKTEKVWNASRQKVHGRQYKRWSEVRCSNNKSELKAEEIPKYNRYTKEENTHTHTLESYYVSKKKKNATYFLKDFYGSNKRPQELSRDHEKEGRKKNK